MQASLPTARLVDAEKKARTLTQKVDTLNSTVLEAKRSEAQANTSLQEMRTILDGVTNEKLTLKLKVKRLRKTVASLRR